MSDQENQNSSDLPNKAVIHNMVQRELPNIFNLCICLTSNPQNAFSLCRDTFVRALKNSEHFTGNQKISHWLTDIATNLWRQEFKKGGKRHPSDHLSPDNEEEQEEGNEAEDNYSLPEKSFPDSKPHKKLFAAMEHMDPEEKLILILKDIRNLTYEEIGDLLELHLGTVKSRLSRARDHLRDQDHRLEGKIL